MIYTHELGHIFGGFISGGTLKNADLLPWHLPYSIFEPDLHPLITLWCGPLIGVLVPLAIASCVQKHWMWFVTHFCLLANGAYLAAAWVSGDRFLDTPKLLKHGAYPVTILIYCILTISFGYVGFRREWLHAQRHHTYSKPTDSSLD